MSALEGRTCVVVGGSRGIGSILAGELAARGADLVLAARSAAALEARAEELAGRFPVRVEWHAVDVADRRSVDELAAFAREIGPVHGVLNCAAVLGPVGRIDQVDPAEWQRALVTDLVGTASCCAAFADVMADTGGGSIVNFSGGGIGGPRPPARISAYTTAKAGVVALTETLGIELAELGIRVNAVAPGPVNTGFMAEVLEGGSERAGSALFDLTVAQQADPQPTDGLVDLVVFLLSPASAGVTGRFLSARWDPVATIEGWDVVGEPSRFTLRRIDEDLFGWIGDRA